MILRTFDTRIESLRGYAAFMVMVRHLSVMNWFDEKFNLADFTRYEVSGHVYVLIFFIISGYVIGLNYPKEDFATFDLKKYLIKRFVRIYPIYVIAILLTLVISSEGLDIITGNFFFLQNFLVENLSKNTPLWTISHEIVYYILFALIATFRLNHFIIFSLSVLTSLSCIIYPQMPAMIIALSTGFSYWCTGMLIAWYFPFTSVKSEENKTRFYIPVLLLLLLCDKLNILYGFIPNRGYEIGWGLQNKVNVYDWVFFPFCFSAFLVYSNRNSRFLIPSIIVSYCAMLASMAYSIVKRGSDYYGLTTYFLVSLAILLLFTKVKSEKITKLAVLGSVSFALYVIHTPLMFIAKLILPASDSQLLYFFKLLIYVICVFILSYLLEKKLQPRIRKLFS